MCTSLSYPFFRHEYAWLKTVPLMICYMFLSTAQAVHFNLHPSSNKGMLNLEAHVVKRLYPSYMLLYIHILVLRDIEDHGLTVILY